MKIIENLVVAIALVTLIGVMGTAPAAAVEFNLSGRFSDSSLNPLYDDGNFNGTYSIDDSA